MTASSIPGPNLKDEILDLAPKPDAIKDLIWWSVEGKSLF